MAITLESLRRGSAKPPIIVLYGTHGVGKTTFATGAAMDRDNVKRNLKQTFLGERLVQDINLKTGEITDRYELKHTSELDKGEMHAFMTCIDAWATEHGIYLPHPEDSEYMKMRSNMGEAA